MISKVISLAATSAFVGVDALQLPGAFLCAMEDEDNFVDPRVDECIVDKYRYRFTSSKVKGCFFKNNVYTLTVCLKESGELKKPLRKIL